MRVFAISDLHLALAENKPMDIFGPAWEGYMRRIRENWFNTVGEEDLVLLAGDLSWATYLEKAGPDFQYIESLPGKKIISKGNHDYWWSTRSKLEKFADREGLSSISFLHNNAFMFGNVSVVGTRGWKLPDEDGFTSDDEKIYQRELERLKISLQHTKGFNGTLLAMLHYPPFSPDGKPGKFVELLRDYGVSACIYGHLHGKRCVNAVTGEREGIHYYLVSADSLQFTPQFLGNW